MNGPDCLFEKYLVTKNPVQQAFQDRYFVLAPKTDPNARLALRAYADACEKDWPNLATEIRAWLGRIEYGEITTKRDEAA